MFLHQQLWIFHKGLMDCVKSFEAWYLYKFKYGLVYDLIKSFPAILVKFLVVF